MISQRLTLRKTKIIDIFLVSKSDLKRFTLLFKLNILPWIMHRKYVSIDLNSNKDITDKDVDFNIQIFLKMKLNKSRIFMF